MSEQKRTYVAICVRCVPVLPVPFDIDAERLDWIGRHQDANPDHTVVTYVDPPTPKVAGR
jgi:hypothetical protein